MPSQNTTETNADAVDPAPGNAAQGWSRRAALLVATGIVVSVILGFVAGYFSVRVTSSTVLARLTDRAPPRASAAQTDVAPPVAGPPEDRLVAMDRVIDQAEGGDASVLPFLVARARLLLFEAYSPMAALGDLDRVLALPQSDEAPEAAYLRVRALFESGALSRALSESHALFKLCPRSWRTADVLSRASDVLEASGQVSEAVALIEDVLPQDPRRADRSHLDTGRRGRYPPRMEPVLLSLGRMHLRTGDPHSAEAAFALVCRPLLGPDDFGETYNVSPHMDEADVGWCEAVVKQNDPRMPAVRVRLARLAEHSSGAPRRRARFVLRGPDLSPSERALVLVEARQLSEAAYESGSATLDPHHAEVALRAVVPLAFADPHGALGVAHAVAPQGLSTRGREDYALSRSRALEALGRPQEAADALMEYRSERLALALADLARRYPGVIDGDDLRRVARHCTGVARLVMDRGIAR